MDLYSKNLIIDYVWQYSHFYANKLIECEQHYLDGRGYTYYYNTKRLKESDFSDSLDNWKGHWIILSAIFGKITSEDKETEICAGIVPEKENENFLKSYIKSGTENIGVITLFIRPQKQVRKRLSEITDAEEFQKERNKIKISDYEFYYTSRSQMDFTDIEVYKDIVGDLENGSCSDPDEDDDEILGCRLNISDVQDHPIPLS